MLSALDDFQLALSAADFLTEADEDEKYSYIELRRFRCFEQTAIISYARPFSQSKGRIPRLSLKQCGAELTPEQQEVHDTLIALRNKLVAHSDFEMMNFAAKAHKTDLKSDLPHYVLLAQHDEGLQFYKYSEQQKLIDLIQTVTFSLYKKLYDEAQLNPKLFDFVVHYPEH